jgi:DNA modification methylase
MRIMPKKRAFPDNFMDKLICGDCLSIMREMPDECLYLIVTSPPYNLKNSTGNGMKDGRGGKWKNAALYLTLLWVQAQPQLRRL